jgi:hypothetical protein
MNTYEAQELRMLQYFGYRPSRAALCPRVVAGKRHLGYRYSRNPCLCLDFIELFDHGRMWIAPSGEHILTGEPYVINEPLLEDFRSRIADLGLVADVRPQSAWFPGHTKLIVVHRWSPEYAL